MAKARQGICKLTGEAGTFVDAHILPKALTYPAEKGRPFAQAGADTPPIRRWSSWYDPAIVTRAGEDILADYDDFAIAELRKHKLVWSGWGAAETLPSNDYTPLPPFPGVPAGGVRVIRGVDGQRLRLFFLSILWRAAVSSLPEFGEVILRSSEVRRLRRMLIDQDPLPLTRFPVTLHQIMTRGAVHNHAALAERRPVDIRNVNGASAPIFRFYLDGLVAHVHRAGSEKHIATFRDRMLGGPEPLFVTTTDFATSRQHETLATIMRSAQQQWPERLERISRPK